MRTILDNTFVVVGARLVLGVMFVIASADKIADPLAFAASIAGYKLVSGTLAIIIATVLPWMELISGLLLVFGVFRNAGRPRAAG